MRLAWDSHKMEIRRNERDNFDMALRNNYSAYGVTSKFVLKRLKDVDERSVQVHITD